VKVGHGSHSTCKVQVCITAWLHGSVDLGAVIDMLGPRHGHPICHVGPDVGFRDIAELLEPFDVVHLSMPLLMRRKDTSTLPDRAPAP
jgi:hypothetical protein